MLAFLAAARCAQYAAACLLFGLSAFPRYALARGKPVARGEPLARFDRTVPACAVLCLVTAVLELGAMAASMGGSPGAMLDPQILAAALTDTVFGRVWAGRMALAAVLAGLAFARRGWPGGDVCFVPLAGLFLASIALTGHAAMPGGAPGWLHRLADALHLLAAGWWIGGLAALALGIREMGMRGMGEHLAQALRRFSRVGYGAVALIVLTGLVNSVILLGPLSSLWTTGYGRVLLVKLGLFAGMGLLALSNRFHVVPALARGGDRDSAEKRLRWQVRLELACGLGVLAAVGLLGALPPPISL